MTELQATAVDAERTEERDLMRRVTKFAALGYVLMAIPFVANGDLRGFLGLTCSATVVIINFLWLERIVVKFLQPAPVVKASTLALRTFARFAVFAVALSVSIIVVRFNALSVLLGFSTVVVGIMGEAAYSLYKSIAE